MRLVNLYNPQSPQTGFVVSYQMSSMIISCVTVILVVFLCFNTKQLDEFSLLYGLSLLTVDKPIESYRGISLLRHESFLHSTLFQLKRIGL